jgi:hypothetical protein
MDGLKQEARSHLAKKLVVLCTVVGGNYVTPFVFTFCQDEYS